jgi:hypothetical protein
VFLDFQIFIPHFQYYIKKNRTELLLRCFLELSKPFLKLIVLLFLQYLLTTPPLIVSTWYAPSVVMKNLDYLRSKKLLNYLQWKKVAFTIQMHRGNIHNLLYDLDQVMIGQYVSPHDRRIILDIVKQIYQSYPSRSNRTGDMTLRNILSRVVEQSQREITIRRCNLADPKLPKSLYKTYNIHTFILTFGYEATKLVVSNKRYRDIVQSFLTIVFIYLVDYVSIKTVIEDCYQIYNNAWSTNPLDYMEFLVLVLVILDFLAMPLTYLYNILITLEVIQLKREVVGGLFKWNYETESFKNKTLSVLSASVRGDSKYLYVISSKSSKGLYTVIVKQNVADLQKEPNYIIYIINITIFNLSLPGVLLSNISRTLRFYDTLKPTYLSDDQYRARGYTRIQYNCSIALVVSVCTFITTLGSLIAQYILCPESFNIFYYTPCFTFGIPFLVLCIKTYNDMDYTASQKTVYGILVVTLLVYYILLPIFVEIGCINFGQTYIRWYIFGHKLFRVPFRPTLNLRILDFISCGIAQTVYTKTVPSYATLYDYFKAF